MNNENNVPQVNGNVPAQKDNSGKNNSRQPRARGELKAEFAHVLAFLNSCTLYQAGRRACHGKPCHGQRQV